jgi:hypothetical protein
MDSGDTGEFTRRVRPRLGASPSHPCKSVKSVVSTAVSRLTASKHGPIVGEISNHAALRSLAFTHSDAETGSL